MAVLPMTAGSGEHATMGRRVGNIGMTVGRTDISTDDPRGSIPPGIPHLRRVEGTAGLRSPGFGPLQEHRGIGQPLRETDAPIVGQVVHLVVEAGEQRFIALIERESAEVDQGVDGGHHENAGPHRFERAVRNLVSGQGVHLAVGQRLGLCRLDGVGAEEHDLRKLGRRGFQMHAVREIRRGPARGDPVGVAAVGHLDAAGSGDPGPCEHHAVFVNEPDDLEKAGLVGGFRRNADPVVARQIAVFGERAGIGRAHEQRVAELDVPGRERDRRHPGCIERPLLEDGDAAAHDVVLGGGRKQPDPGPDIDAAAMEG